jgi:4-amino-4-deoxy-L-arabinose transferase-like glycosyltransferase
MQHSAELPAGSRRFSRHWTWWFTVATLVLVAAIRLRLLNLPLERDEGEYAYAGQLMLQGIPPYELAYNMKFPGTYAAYALIMAGFGETPAGIHLGVLCVTTLTALMLYWLGKKMLDATAGLVAATSYAVLAASSSMLGLAGHATHFVALFATAGLCLMWKARQGANWPATAGAGLMFGLAILMKQPAALIGLWAAAALVMNRLRRHSPSAGRRLYEIAAFGAGIVLPFGLCCLILWRAGVFEKFWFWTMDYARHYASIVPLANAPVFFWLSFSKATSMNFLLWLPAFAGLWLVRFDERLSGARWWLAGFCLASALATCPGFYFRPHYFLLALPAAALMAGCAVSVAARLWRQKTGASNTGAWPVWGYALLLAATIAANRETWFVLTPAQAERSIYGLHPFAEAETAAAFISANSPPGARAAVLGSEPEIYFLSGRHSATGYIYTFPLMEPQPFAVQMQDEMIREIEGVSPQFVIFATGNLSWMKRPESDPKIFEWWASYQTNYVLDGIADVISSTETRYAWGAEPAARYGRMAGSGLEIYRRKPDAPRPPDAKSF